MNHGVLESSMIREHQGGWVGGVCVCGGGAVKMNEPWCVRIMHDQRTSGGWGAVKMNEPWCVRIMHDQRTSGGWVGGGLCDCGGGGL